MSPNRCLPCLRSMQKVGLPPLFHLSNSTLPTVSKLKRLPGCQCRQIPVAQLLVPFRHRVVDELVYFVHSLSILRLYLRKVLTLGEGWGRVRGVDSEEDVADVIHNLRLAGESKAIAA